MSTAAPFKALGAGNGFPVCLGKSSVLANQSTSQFITSAPDIEQTMNSYWNFKSASFGLATFEPPKEPGDLAADPYANLGSDRQVDNIRQIFITSNGRTFVDSDDYINEIWTVRNSMPSIFVDDQGKKHYEHGISMEFQRNQSLADEDTIDQVIVDYSSPRLTIGGSPYNCSVYYTTHGHAFGPYHSHTYDVRIGQQAEETIVSESLVMIEGLPFVKRVIQDFGGAAYDETDNPATCSMLSPARLPPTAQVPTLTFHTYT